MVVLFLLASRYDKISGLYRYTYTGTSVSGEREKKKSRRQISEVYDGAKKQKQQRIIWVTLTGSSSRMCDEWG